MDTLNIYWPMDSKVGAELDGITVQDDVIQRQANKGIKMFNRCHDKHSLNGSFWSYSYFCRLMMKMQSLVRRSRIRTVGPLRSGVTAVETTMIMPLFLLLCFGIIEVSILHLAASNIEGQVAVAARQIRTGNIQNSGDPLAEFNQLLCGEVTFIDCADLIVDVRNFPSFGDVDFGEYFDDEGNPTDNEFNPGGAGDTVLVRVAYRWEILTPFLAPYLGDGGGGTKLLHAAAVFRSEPYDGQD